MKLPSILALIVILFLSLSVVSADEIVQDVTNTSDSVIDDSIGISDSYNNLASNFDDSISDDSSNLLNSNLTSDEETIELVDENQDLDDEITSDDLKDSNKLSSSSVSDSEEIIVSTEPITIDSSNYSKYFDATNGGLIKPGALKDGDTIRLKSMSDKVFSINVRLNIFSDDGDQLSNCLIRLIEGSSGTVITNVRIVNTKEKASRSNYYVSGISIINSDNNTIENSLINVSVHKCFAIMMSNASHNRIINNTLISGLSTTIPMTASSYNEIRGNYIESEMANMVYQSAYGNGDFMPIDDEVCTGNIIANNYLKSRNGTYNSYCYAIYLMQTASGPGAVIANNTLEDVYHAIMVDASNALIYNNRRPFSNKRWRGQCNNCK